jgi:hypothetical protein
LVYYVTNEECCYSRYFQVLNVGNLKIIVSKTKKKAEFEYSTVEKLQKQKNGVLRGPQLGKKR